MDRPRDPRGPSADDRDEPREGRPRYEPPRIVRKRSVSRATLASSFEGCGPDGCPALGVTAGG